MDDDAVSDQLRRVANLLALRQIEGKGKGEQALILNAAGFRNADIAALIGISESSVRAHLSARRRRLAGPEE
jgi:DNA-binding NarL/FixJ family response regulator